VIVAEHFARTHSEVAKALLADWHGALQKFVQVHPPVSGLKLLVYQALRS
jgi:glutamate synthase domain-containing protein 3